MIAMVKKTISKSNKLKLVEELIQDASAKNANGDLLPVIVEKKRKPGYSEDGTHKGSANLKPFQPGTVPNPHGRPKDPLKALGLRIAQLKMNKVLNEKEEKYIQDLGMDTADLKVIEHIMLSLATSGHPAKLEMFLDRVYGKVPNININTEMSAILVSKFRAKFTDAELQRIVSGEDALEVLISKLPDVDQSYEIIDAEDDEEYEK